MRWRAVLPENAKRFFYSNQELKGLGFANIIGAFFQSFTVVGGFSRTAVNVDAGATSPLASVLSVVVMAVCVLWFAPYLAPLPYAVLGANIMVAIVSLIDMTTFKKSPCQRPIGRFGVCGGTDWRVGIWVKYWLGGGDFGVVCRTDLAVKSSAHCHRWTSGQYGAFSQYSPSSSQY